MVDADVVSCCLHALVLYLLQIFLLGWRIRIAIVIKKVTDQKKYLGNYFSENYRFRFQMNRFPNYLSESYRFRFPDKNQQIYFQLPQKMFVELIFQKLPLPKQCRRVTSIGSLPPKKLGKSCRPPQNSAETLQDPRRAL